LRHVCTTSELLVWFAVLLLRVVAHAIWHGRRVSHYRVDGLYLHGVSALMQGRAGEPQLIPPLLEALVNDPVISGVALYAADVHPLEVRAFLHASPPGLCRSLKGSCRTTVPCCACVRWRCTPPNWRCAKTERAQMGRLPHWGALVERNVLFRDDVRRFLSGGSSGSSTVAAFGARLCGSGDYFAPARTPQASLNVISGPDGRSAADALLPAAAAAAAAVYTADGEARVLCPRDGAFMPVDGSRVFNTAAPAPMLPVEHRQVSTPSQRWAVCRTCPFCGESRRQLARSGHTHLFGLRTAAALISPRGGADAQPADGAVRQPGAANAQHGGRVRTDTRRGAVRAQRGQQQPFPLGCVCGHHAGAHTARCV
jgi:hypothetical protein